MIQQAESDISAQEMVDILVRDVFDGGDDSVTNCPYPTVSDSENWARFHCGRLTGGGKMNKSDRDVSGYEFSTQAADMLDEIEFTPDGVDRFFSNLSRKSSVELSRFRVRFFIRGNKVCVSKLG